MILESIFEPSFLSNMNHRRRYLAVLPAGYLEFKVYQHSLIGGDEVPQGSIISPILSNIYLHELDKYVIKLTKEFETGIRGSMADCRSILEKVTKYLKHELMLEVSVSKTKITNLNNDRAIFLGFNICRAKQDTFDEIILLYNSVYRGIMQYYSFVNNKNVLSARMYLILKSSCAKLLASKFTLGTQAAVFKKFGKNLKGSNKAAFSPIST
ncbi:hypothetical protein L249_8324 [Ophiocordyceps polyrhachis-furcata BCC 54312]|uniref:Reverse transcriptase domain-containing protein n=1 Tax=Ophiocordyceps polyrhachis-furcata BCC 54312 TaxID=1330021 RepID=A0A367KZC3_9HYPO|nr:hypothetical protein L249_8324 [Ophiocordyceps polyrhachis-furcata BCC 54312]